MGRMNNCECINHCDHSLGERWTDGGTTTIKRYRCCHCGRVREELVTRAPGNVWTEDASKHGPHRPQPIKRFGA